MIIVIATLCVSTKSILFYPGSSNLQNGKTSPGGGWIRNADP